MGLFTAKEKSTKYNVVWNEWTPDSDLEKWSADPDCIEKEKCAALLAERLARRAQQEAEHQKALAIKREYLQTNPFDPRTEVSADAKHIASKVVTHLWILFVALPVVLGILFAILK